jgi:zinc transporter ZupT
MKVRAIICRVASVEATTLLGGAAGLIFFPDASKFWMDFALAHAGGGFIFLGTHAILGEILKHHKALVLSSFGAGFGVIGLFVLLRHLM